MFKRGHSDVLLTKSEITMQTGWPNDVRQESPAIADKPARRESLPKLLQFDVPTTLSLTISAYYYYYYKKAVL